MTDSFVVKIVGYFQPSYYNALGNGCRNDSYFATSMTKELSEFTTDNPTAYRKQVGLLCFHHKRAACLQSQQ